MAVDLLSKVTTKKYPIALNDDFVDRIVSSICGAVPTEAIYVFGSYARGDQTSKSDIDLYVILQGEDHDLLDMTSEAFLSLDWTWDVIQEDIFCADKKAFERMKKRKASVESAIQREGVKIYG